MSSSIEVRIAKRGRVRDGVATEDAAQVAHCELCNADVDVVASTSQEGSSPYACKACLRGRLEAMTLGSWLLRDPAAPAQGGVPWGKVSG
jgi:hypothetical protein